MGVDHAGPTDNALALHNILLQGSSPLGSSKQQQPLLPIPTGLEATGGGDPSLLIPLLTSLTSADNDARNIAEQAFNQLKDSHPEALIYGLLEVSNFAVVALFSCDLLKALLKLPVTRMCAKKPCEVKWK